LQNDRIGPQDTGWRSCPQPISCDAALQLLLSRPFTNTPETIAAISRIQNALDGRPAGPDAAVKMFYDLEEVLFRGELRRRVIVRWASNVNGYPLAVPLAPEGAIAITIPPGGYRQPRAAILINALFPYRISLIEIVGFVVHEMIHAWYLVHCGGDIGDDQASLPGHDEHHGYYFFSAAESVMMNVVQCLLRDDITRGFTLAFQPQGI